MQKNQAEEQAPGLLQSMQSVMNADIALDETGNIRLFHDKPLSDRLEYVEFNFDTGQLCLVLRWGKIQPFGEEVPKKYHNNFKEKENIYVILGQDSKIIDAYDSQLFKQGTPPAGD